MSVPIKLLLEQGPMLNTLGRIALSSILPSKKPSSNPEQFPEIVQHIKAPSKSLISHYLRWAGAADNRYDNQLPPHLFSQFALPVCSKQLEMTHYNLAGIMNQGCSLKINGPLPLDTDLKVSCRVVDIVEDNGRARINQQLSIGTQEQDNLIEAHLHTVFVIGKSEKSPRIVEGCKFEYLGQWDAAKHAGFEFGLLTGDLNPIHWIGLAGKYSAFKTKVLHGFGMFVRSYEAIQNALDKDIQAIDVRFISPVHLPSQDNQIFCAAEKSEDGSKALELRSTDGRVNIVGRFSLAD